MSAKSMSIFMLKTGQSVDQALADTHGYDEVATNSQAPSQTRFFVHRSKRKQPWWRDYFGIAEELGQRSNSAIAFVPVSGVTFALTFGYGHYVLKDDSYDHDFGTRVALNSVDPKRLKSTDTLDPESSQRRRTQMPFDADLALLSFTGDSSVLKSITGKARPDLVEIARSVTGASSLRVTTPVTIGDLSVLLIKLKELSESHAYKSTFPEIDQIRPVTDPELLKFLDSQLTSGVFDKGAPILLSVPDILDYDDEATVSFSGVGASEVFDDVYIKHYREYLELHGVTENDLELDDLRRHRLNLLDSELQPVRYWSIYRSLVFEISGSDGYSFHFSDGMWYRVADTLVSSLRDYLDPFFIATDLPPHVAGTENDYNNMVASDPRWLCLDRTSIRLPGQTALEPCDLIQLEHGSLNLLYVKLGTSSELLSHLFNQGVNAVQLIRTESAALERFKSLIRDSLHPDAAAMIEALAAHSYKLQYVIVTHKRDFDSKSDLLPLFSRLSLRRQLIALKAMAVEVSVTYVRDQTDRAGRKKPRKKRTTSSGLNPQDDQPSG